MQKYHERFAEGMVLKAAERERLIEYHPASPSLMLLGHSSAAFAAVRIPNVLGLQSQFVHLSQIWNGCVEELRDFSRAAGKGLDTTTREAWEALPPALRKEVDHPDASHWKAIATSHVHEDGFSFAPISKLAEIQGFQPREKMTAAQSRSLARTAEDIGLAIIPDARITGRTYAWSDEVVLFQPEEDASLAQESCYRAASCMLELGMIVAGADGKIDPEETARIEQFLDNQFRLSSDESRRLKAYGILLSKRPPSISSLSRSLQEALTLDQRAMIGKYLIGVAAANGIIDRKEISSLKSIYKALEIETPLDALLAELRQSGSQPVEVQRIRREERIGEAIPQRELMPVDKPSDITLNSEALTRIMAETAEVSRILGQALCENESEMNKSEVVERAMPSAVPVSSRLLLQIPTCHFQRNNLRRWINATMHRWQNYWKEQVWSSDDLTKLAKRHQLMRSGMLDAINSWAYDSSW